MSTREKVYILIAEGRNNKEISEELNISLRSVQIYRKEYEAKDEIKGETKNEKRKRKKEKAKALIITGATLKETAEELAQEGTTIDIVKKLSSKENLQQSQLEYLNNFRNEYIQEITRNKKDRVCANTLIKEKLVVEIANIGEATKKHQELLILNEETEQKIFELNRIERLEKLKLEQDNNKYKFMNEFVKELEAATVEEITEVLEMFKRLKDKRTAEEV